VFQNLQDATFRDVSAQAGPDMQVRAAHRGCAFGDLNNDGKIDVVVSPLVIMPIALQHHNQQQPLDSASGRSRSKATGTELARASKSQENPAWCNTTM